MDSSQCLTLHRSMFDVSVVMFDLSVFVTRICLFSRLQILFFYLAVFILISLHQSCVCCTFTFIIICNVFTYVSKVIKNIFLSLEALPVRRNVILVEFLAILLIFFHLISI